jgi:DNA-binding CsgD family transcriptional regulator
MWQRPLVLLLLTELDAHKQFRTSLLRQLFGITPAEASLAYALMAGYSTDDYAVRNKLGESTVRTQIKAALAKTGTRCQAELVALLARIPVTG